MRILVVSIGVIALTFLGACAGYGPDKNLSGKDRAAVIALMGEPAADQKTASGSRLIYPRGPYGRHTYFVELNKDGQVIRWEQVLTEKNFKLISPGKSKAEVETLIGPSFIKTQLARNRGEVWAYRFETPFCIWFEIEFTAEGLVRSAGHGYPPECLRDDALFRKPFWPQYSFWLIR